MTSDQKAELRRLIRSYATCRATQEQYQVARTACPHVPMIEAGLEAATAQTVGAWDEVCALIDAI